MDQKQFERLLAGEYASQQPQIAEPNRIGRSGYQSEAALRETVQLTPEERLLDQQTNANPAVFAELEREIRNARDPKVRAVLEQELSRQRDGGQVAPAQNLIRPTWVADESLPDFGKARRRADAQAKADESPISTQLGRGVKTLAHNVGLLKDTLLDDSEGAAQRIVEKRKYDEENPQPTSVQDFTKDWNDLSDDDYLGMAKTFLKNPSGTFGMMVEQTPNSIPGLAANIAALGLTAFNPAMGFATKAAIQGIASLAGNLGPEGGAVIEERLQKAGVDPDNHAQLAQWLKDNRADNLVAGVSKAGVISVADAVTANLGAKLMAGPSMRFANAEREFLTSKGVDLKDAAKIRAARATDDYKAAMQPFAKDVADATGKAQLFGRAVGSTLLDAAGEGAGEYLGSMAAHGEASVKDAVLEGVMGVGQGTAMAGAGYALGKLSGPDATEQEIRKLAEYQVKQQARQPDPQPNSPLSNAAQAATPVDPFADALAPITQRLNDRDLFAKIRGTEQLGPQAMSDILASYRVATNPGVEPMQRQAAIDRLNEFFKAFDTMPNFTFGNSQQGGAQPASNLPAVTPSVPGSQGGFTDPSAGAINGESRVVNDPAADGGQRRLAPPPRRLPAPPPALIADNREAQRIVAEYEAAYQDLVKADNLLASDQELMQRQLNLRNAEARLAELNQVIEASRVQESAKKRDALLSDVLASLPPGQNPMRAFDRALKQAGFTDTSFTDAEKAKISRFVELSGMQEEQQPSPVITTPNEGGDFGIKEKIVSSTPATKTVADLVNSGWKWDGGWNLSGPKGEVKKLKGGERQFLKNHVAKVRAENAASGISSARNTAGNRDQEAGVGDAGILDGGNRPASDGSGGVSLAGAPDGAVQSAVPVVVPDQPGNSLTQGEGGNGLSSTEQVAEEAVQANDAQAGAEQGAAPLGEVAKQSSRGRRSTPLSDSRIQKYSEDLKSMAPDAGWAEEGGKLLRDADGTPYGRSKWIPRAEWFRAGMIGHPDEVSRAVEKAVSGLPMKASEKRTIQGMMDWLDSMNGVESNTAPELEVIDAEGIGNLQDPVQEAIDDFADIDFENLPAQNLEEGLRALGFTEDYINEQSRAEAEYQAVPGNDRLAETVSEGAAQGDVREDSSAVGGSSQEEFALARQTNEDAARDEQIRAVGVSDDSLTKDQIDRERDAVPFALEQQSQSKPVGSQGGLFTADGRASVDAIQKPLTPKYAKGDRITPDHDVIEGDVVKSEDGKLWMAKVKRGISMPVLPIEDGKPVVNADVARRFDLTQTVVTHTGMNVYGYGGQPKMGGSDSYKGPADVSSRAGQMELANRAGTIAALKAMNNQLRQIAPDEAWADTNIEDATDLDTLRNRISQALVDAQRKGRSDENPLRKTLNEMSGQELKAVFDKIGLAGKLMSYEERIDALLAEDAAEVQAAIADVLAESKAGMDSTVNATEQAKTEEVSAKREELQSRIEIAEQQTNHDATPAQKEAGNYAKGKFSWNGLTVSVETAKGEERTDKETNGDKWRVTMPATYGYILGTVGADKDHVDVFMGDSPESDLVFVVNQNKVDSQSFDEHKVMAGFSSAKDARDAYLGSFEGDFGKRVLGSISGPYSVKAFREMLGAGAFGKAKPVGEAISQLSFIDIDISGDQKRADVAIQEIDNQLSLADQLLACVLS